MAEVNDKDLERIAARLGRTAGERLDVEHTVDRVLARLRSAETAPAPRALPWQRGTWLRIAAALVLTLGSAIGVYRWQTSAGTNEPGSPAIVALQSLSADELEEVLDSLAVDAPVHDIVAVGLQDLDDEQLSELLQRMEG